MTKILNVKKNTKKSTSSTYPFNIKEIIKSHIHDRDLLHALITDIYSIPHQKGNRYGSGEIAIFTNENEAFIRNFNPQKTQIPCGNLNAQLKELTKNISGIDRVKEQLSVLKKIGASTLFYHEIESTSTKSFPQKKQKTPTPKKPTTQPKQKSKFNLDYEVAPKNSDAYKFVLDYFDIKTGVYNSDELSMFGIVPIISKSGTTKNGKKYKFTFGNSSKNIAFIYRDGRGDQLSELLKQPYDKIAKFIWLKKPKDYIYLLDHCELLNCHTCIICGGQDDAICINTYFNYLGVCAVAIGGETKIISNEIMSKLRSRFKKIVLCFDYDKDSKTGQKWSLENSRVHNVPFINLAETAHLFNHQVCKDFCEMHKSIYLTSPRKFTKIGEYFFLS